MDKKQITKRYLSLFLALIMLIGMMPMNIFAEVKSVDWDMSEEEITDQTYWPLPAKAKLETVSPLGEPIKSPNIQYKGRYVNDEGRVVIRLTLRFYPASVSSVWHNIMMKVENDLNDMVDWQYKDTGIYSGRQNNKLDDAKGYTEITKFSNLTYDEAGTTNVKTVNIYSNGYYLLGNPAEVPINLVLKAGKSENDLKREYVIQTRLTDSKYEKVYTDSKVKLGDQSGIYSSYTFGSIIPKKDYRQDLVDAVSINGKAFLSGTSFVEYNVEDGYIDVNFHYNNREVLDNYYGSIWGFRQSVDKRFYDVLKPQGDSNIVATVFLKDNDGKVVRGTFSGGGYDPAEGYKSFNSLQSVSIKQDELNYKDSDSVGFIQVANDKYRTQDYSEHVIKTKYTANTAGNAYLFRYLSETNYGGSTVVRYYIDKDKLAQTFDDGVLQFFPFYSAFTLDAQEDKHKTLVTEFTAEKNMVITPGANKITVDYDHALNKKLLTKYDESGNMSMVIGEGANSISLASNFSSTGSDRTQYVYELQKGMGMTIKKGTKITLYNRYPTGDPFTSAFARLTFSTVDGNAVLGPENVQVKEASRLPRYQETFSAGSIAGTYFLPDIDEVFDTDREIKGGSYYQGARVNYTTSDLEEGNPNKVAYFVYAKESADTREVNGTSQIAYPFSVPVGLPKNGPLTKLEKDQPISFTNEDVKSLATPSNPPVIEQVQAKVKFHNNLPDDKGIVEKIAPLNKNYKYDPTSGALNPAYVPNGFETEAGKDEQRRLAKGSQVLADHEDKELTGNALELRQYPKPEPKNNKVIVGYTTQPLSESNGKSPEKQLEELKEAKKIIRTADDWDNAKTENYVFDQYSPVLKTTDVYAVWGQRKIILHANTSDTDDKTYEIPLTEDLFNDGVAEIDIPKPFYNATEKGDKELDGFKKDKNTFVGWFRDKDSKTAEVGNHINSEYWKGNQSEEAGGVVPLNDLTAENSKVLLPRGYKLKIEGTFEDWIKKEDINLYAAYRPYANITLTKGYKELDPSSTPTMKVYKEWESKNDSKKHAVKMGLLYRTHVTNYKDPTVHQAANYYTIKQESYPDVTILPKYDPAQNNKVNWELPLYDERGVRLSYSAVEVPEGKESDYYNFGSEWNKLGIQIYTRFPAEGQGGEVTQDPSAWEVPGHEPMKTSKTQSVTFKNTDNTVDAFTSATYRKTVEDKEGAITGYDITMTNILTDVPTPNAKDVFDGDNTFYMNYDNDLIDKVQLRITKVDKDDKNDTGEKIITLKKNPADNTWTVDGLSGATSKVGEIGGLLEGKKYISFTRPSENPFVNNIDESNPQESQYKEKIYVTNFIGDQKSDERAFTVQKAKAQPVENYKQLKKSIESNAEFANVEMTIPGTTLDTPKATTKFSIVDAKGNVVAGPVEMGSKTAGSTIEFKIPKDKATGELKFVTEAESGFKVENNEATPKTIKADGVRFTLDLEGPEIKKATLEDDKFRDFVKLNSQLNELPDGSKVTIQIKDKSGQVEKEFRDVTKEEADVILKDLQYKLKGTVLDKTITIVASDKFGNETEKQVDYTPTYELVLNSMQPRKNSGYVLVKGETNVAVTVTILGENSTEKAKGEATMNGKFVKVMLNDTDGQPYKLQAGDEINIYGEITKDSNKYTTNPFKYFINK